MKRRIFRKLFCSLFFTAVIFSAGQAQVSEAEKLYEQGIYQLEAVGNFEEAIQIFNRVVNEFSSEKQVAAKALLKLGFCYERQGSQKAEEAYIRIIEKFPNQSQEVAEARERLALLRQQNDTAGQTIKLTFDEGTRYTNSLSPDGTKMAITDFSEGQNVAYYDFTSNERTLVTHYTWYDKWTFFPIWSPPGNEIAYIKSGWADIDPYSLCISTLDGKERVIYSDTTPGSKIFPSQWLPNGKGIVAVRQGSSGSSLGIFGVEGEGFENLRHLAEDNMYTASVSPDSRYVVFSDGKRGNMDIHIIDLQNKEITTLTDNPADDNAPRWSPDGGYIVFKSNRHGDYALWGLKVRDAQPQGAPFMIMTGVKDMQLLNWTESGLAFSTIVRSSDIYRMPVDPVTGKSLGQPVLIRYTPTGSNFNPVWSPDGEHIAFFARNRENGQLALEVISNDCSEKHEFILPPRCGAGTLRWTPDGKAIGYIGNDSTQNHNLFRLTLETGEWESWPLGLGYWAMMEWGKDGKTYYYSDNGLNGADEKIVRCSLGSTERENIYPGVMNKKGAFSDLRCSRDYTNMAIQYGQAVSVMEMETQESAVVTPPADSSDFPVPPISYRSPAWSPDGTKILMTKTLVDENMNQTSELCVLDLGSGEIEKIDMGDKLPKDVQLRSIDWSPDGKEVLLGSTSWVLEDHLMRSVIPKESRSD